jgi:hypothetical protein
MTRERILSEIEASLSFLSEHKYKLERNKIGIRWVNEKIKQAFYFTYNEFTCEIDGIFCYKNGEYNLFQLLNLLGYEIAYPLGVIVTDKSSLFTIKNIAYAILSELTEFIADSQRIISALEQIKSQNKVAIEMFQDKNIDADIKRLTQQGLYDKAVVLLERKTRLSISDKKKLVLLKKLSNKTQK